MSPAFKEKWFRRLYLPLSIILDIFAVRDEPHRILELKELEGLPEDCEIASINWSNSRQAIKLVICSSHYSPVKNWRDEPDLRV